MDLLPIALLVFSSAVPIAALRISTEGSSSTVVEHATDLVLKCYVMYHNSDDELTSVTWYHVAPPTSVSREIFTLDATREQPAYYFSGKWAGRGMFQPMGEGVVGVTIVLPARFVSRTDAGNYRCQLRSMMTSGFGDVTVSVHYPPGTTLTLSPAGLVQRQEGAELTLTCTAQCSPHCGYRWYKAGRIISSTPIVHISAVSRDDAGLYACQADNLAGSSIKPVDVRVRFSTTVVDVSLSTSPYNPVSDHNAPMMEQPRTSSFAALGEADETSAPISKSNTGESLWQFTVTLVCNVTGWPDPVIKWVSPQTTFKDRTIIESDTPEVQVSNHPWSLSKKSGIGVIRNATCLDNGLYTCFGLNGDSLSKETRPPFFSNRSVLLDLPCPPVDPHSEMVAPMLSLGEKSTKIDGNVKASEFENGSVSLTLCKPTTGNIETDGEFEVIVADLDKTITIIACFVSNPKPSLELRYLHDDRAKPKSDFLRKEGFSLVHRKHVLKETVLNTLKVQPILDGADNHKLRHSGSENNYDSSREISQNLNNVGFGEERLNRGEPRFNEEVKNGVDEITLDQLSVPSFNIDVANTIHIVKPMTLECSRKSSASLCVVEVNITITDPIQYGRYELAANNSHGVSRKKYRVVSRQAPLAPSHFRLEKVSSDSACFSWKAHFDGGAKQSFHLCFRKESETLASATNSQLFEDQIGVESNCKHVTIQSHDLPLISDRGDKHVRSGSDEMNVYSHCQSSLIPSTHYNVTLFSSNKYGKSKVPTTIAFQTNPKHNDELSFWSTTEPTISKVLEPASSTTHATVERTFPGATSNPTTEILLFTSHLSPTEIPSFEDDIETDSENSTINLESSQTELSQEDIFSDQDIEKNAREAHKSSAENEKEDEEDFLDELLFDEDDLIYGEINDVPFFQLFGVNPPLNAEHNNGHFSKSPTENHLSHMLNKTTRDCHMIHNRRKSPPVHLKKLLLRYSRPHTKEKVIKTQISSLNTSYISLTSPNPSNNSSAQPMTTVSYMLREKESTPSSALGKRGLFIVTGIVGVLVIVSAGVLCRICLRLWRRQRRFKLLKKRYRQRVLDRANMRRGSYPSVGVEDANVLGNRLSSLRGRAPSHRRRFNPQAPPMFLPRRDVTQTFQSQDSGSQRNSITCVSNENAFYFPPSSAMQDLPSGLRGNVQNPEQRQLRPTSSTPAIGKVLGHLKKDKTVDRASASFSACSSPTGHRNHLTVPTITVGEDCGFSRTCSPVSIPSYLDLHTDDPALLFDLDPYHARHDHLRPPSHHSSYSSIRQGAPLLLRLDSSSSGATGNYFNLYEGLASRSSRSRSPSNVYDPLTFELSSRSNPPSRRGSRTHTETLHEATQPGMDENSDGNVHPLEGIFVPSDFRPDPDMPASSQADQTSLYRQSPSELHNSVTADSTHTGSLEGASAKTTLKHQHSNHLLASDYERIVKQSPTFLNRKKSNRKDDNLPFGPKRPRKSFELKNLFRQSFPRSTGENISQCTPRDVTTPVNIPRSMQDTDRSLTPLPKHSDKTLNKNGIINNTKPPKAVSRVPPPPISNIKSLQEVEEPIYVDIDDNCKNGNTFPNLGENEAKHHDSNRKPEVKDNNNSITRNQHSDLAEIPPPDPRSKRSRDHAFSEAFVSLTSILADGKPRGVKGRATEKMSSDSSAGCQSSLPDIMLCTDTVKAGEGSEEEAYSTIDFSVGLG